jgi:hypothetical protein
VPDPATLTAFFADVIGFVPGEPAATAATALACTYEGAGIRPADCGRIARPDEDVELPDLDLRLGLVVAHRLDDQERALVRLGTLVTSSQGSVVRTDAATFTARRR